MTRPRIAAIASAIAASAVALLVVRRWSLAGTFTGAAVVPIVCMLVSHWSTECLNHLGKWMRRRVLRRRSADEPAGSTGESARPGARQHADLSLAEGDVVDKPSLNRGSSTLRWSLAVFASLAFAIGVYFLALSAPVEKTAVPEMLIVKTVTVTAQGGSSVAEAPRGEASTTTTPETTTTATTPATTGTSETTPAVDISSTTTSAGQSDQEQKPVSTTVTEPATSTLLP